MHTDVASITKNHLIFGFSHLAATHFGKTLYHMQNFASNHGET